MKIRMAENIRKLRKEQSLTQEQLSEALGVSTGAVSKWESGASIPELGMVMELADFFETSVDALLGYEWRDGGMGRTVERLKALLKQKKLDEGMAEVDKALQKYPNCFDVVYNAARLCSMRGLDGKHEVELRRALELFRRALGMIAMNVDPEISAFSIQNQIATVYQLLGEKERALEEFRKNNLGGLNNVMIGNMLASDHRPDEALPYLSDAFWASYATLFRATEGYANAYSDKHDYASALAMMRWMLGIIDGLKPKDEVCYLERSAAALHAVCAQLEAMMGDREAARASLRKARACAERFDASPAYTLAQLRFYHGKGNTTVYDSFPEKTVEMVRGMLDEEASVREELLALWDEKP